MFRACLKNIEWILGTQYWLLDIRTDVGLSTIGFKTIV